MALKKVFYFLTKPTSNLKTNKISKHTSKKNKQLNLELKILNQVKSMSMINGCQIKQ